MKSYPETL